MATQQDKDEKNSLYSAVALQVCMQYDFKTFQLKYLKTPWKKKENSESEIVKITVGEKKQPKNPKPTKQKNPNRFYLSFLSSVSPFSLLLSCSLVCWYLACWLQ